MSTLERLRQELDFHDRQARDRAVCLPHAENLRFEDEAYLAHETWIRAALEQLGDLRGAHVLDHGCGHGMASVVLARRGARVTAFDLSAGYLLEARRRAEANGVEVDLVQADGERLPFADGSFDRVWGNAILHHLDSRRAASELYRVMRPGALAVFCEPWGGNPLLSLARRGLPYPGKQRTADERPLRWAQLRALRETFPGLEVRGFQLLGMVRRVVGSRGWVRHLDLCDGVLLRSLPGLWRGCRYVVLTLRRELV